MENTNEVILEGMIVHKFVTDKVAIITINTGNATATPNYPKVVYFGEIIKKIDKEFDVKDHIKATGNVQSSRRNPHIKDQNLISIFGESIEKAENIMKKEFEVETDESVYAYQNKLKISGIVTRIEKLTKDVVKIYVMTKKNDRLSFVPLVYYTDNPDKVMKEIKKNDVIYVLGCVQTTKKELKGKIQHFENYVANEISRK